MLAELLFILLQIVVETIGQAIAESLAHYVSFNWLRSDEKVSIKHFLDGGNG